MTHVLAKIKNIPFLVIKETLEKDANFYTQQGMYLENIWQNVDISNEVYFLFKIDNIDNTKRFMQKLHEETIAHNPDAPIAELTYLSN